MNFTSSLNVFFFPISIHGEVQAGKILGPNPKRYRGELLKPQRTLPSIMPRPIDNRKLQREWFQ